MFSFCTALVRSEPEAVEQVGAWSVRSADLSGHVIRLSHEGVTSILSTKWPDGCATDGFDISVFGACPPVVEYSQEFSARAAEELNLLPVGSAVAKMLSDYAVMREQARFCSPEASEIPPGGGGTAM